MTRRVLFAAMVLAMAIVGSERAHANELTGSFRDGHWRLDFTGVGGTYSGKVDRDGDAYFTGSIEYEWPIYARATLGLRAYPLFLYSESSDDDYSDGLIYGAGVGIAARIYQRKEERTGWFIEGGVTALLLTDKFEGNSSSLNFLNEIGVGYKWKNDWHLTAKWEHISNAGLGDDNAGVNGFGLAIGYTF